MSARLSFILALAAALPLAALSARRSIFFDPSQPRQCRVRLEVTGEAEEFPRAYILSENWAQGSVVFDCSWDGQPVEPSRLGCRWRWLFGYGDGNPAASSGVLEYTLGFPGTFVHSSLRTVMGCLVGVSGELSAVTGSAGGELSELEMQSRSGELEVRQGWNFLALPISLDWRRARQLGIENCYALDSSGALVRLEESGGALPAAPVWAYRALPGVAALTLSWAEVRAEATGPSPVVLGGGWGAGAAEDADGPCWFWQEGRYRQMEGGLGAAGWSRQRK